MGRPVGEAEEPEGKGTGGAVVDLDLDGTLELVLSHGESGRQPVTLYKVAEKKGNNFVRVAAMTKSGAPARGARVSLTTDSGWMQTRVIDAGSGYLCQMEPVAHFGLNNEQPTKIEVLFTDGSRVVKDLQGEINTVIKVRQERKRSGRRIEYKPSTKPKPQPCSYIDMHNSEACGQWLKLGYCDSFSIYYDWMLFNCQKTCQC